MNRFKNIGQQIHNEFELTLLGPDGKIKQKAYAYNVVLNQYWALIKNDGYDFSHLTDQIRIGTGTGTPAATDTDLFTPLVAASVADKSYTLAYPTSTYQGSATFVASATYTGTITEVGLYAYYGSSFYPKLITHALLVDAEGNPITIEKTDIDQLIVTFVVYVTLNFPETFIPVLAANNAILRTFANVSTIVPRPTSFNLSLCKSSYAKLGSLTTGTLTSSLRAISFAAYRLPSASTYNDEFVNSIYLTGIGFFPLPDTSIFPVYTLAFMSVGTGVGSTQDFDCPLPEFIEDTDVVKVAGVVQTRDTDYTIDYQGNNIHNFSVSANARADSISSTLNTTTIFRHGNTLYSQDPVITFDLGESKACNYIKLPACYSNFGTRTVSFLLEYSADGTTWNTALSIASQTYPTNSSGTNVPGGPIITFTEVAARYWRFTATFDATGSSYYLNFLDVTANFGHTGNRLHFATAPATGASIIMTANVDRPWKTTDYVIDTTLALTY